MIESVDHKGRIKIPAGLGEKVVAVNSISGASRCLDLFPVKEWASIEKAMSKKPIFQTYFLSGAFECAVENNRITIPKILLVYAGIVGALVTVEATGNKLRIQKEKP